MRKFVTAKIKQVGSAKKLADWFLGQADDKSFAKKYILSMTFKILKPLKFRKLSKI